MGEALSTVSAELIVSLCHCSLDPRRPRESNVFSSLHWFSLKSGTGIPPVNHAQDARATTKLI